MAGGKIFKVASSKYASGQPRGKSVKWGKITKIERDVKTLKRETEIEKQISSEVTASAGNTVTLKGFIFDDGSSGTNQCLAQVDGSYIVNKGIKLRLHMVRNSSNTTGDSVRVTVFKKLRDNNIGITVPDDVYYNGAAMEPYKMGFLDRELSMAQKTLGRNIVVLSDKSYKLSSTQRYKDVVMNIKASGKSVFATDNIAKAGACYTYMRDNFYWIAICSADNTNKAEVQMQWVLSYTR